MSYDHFAKVYDLLAQLYSAGAIHRAKCAHLSQLSSADRVLYVGAGNAAECVDAAARGAQVTIVDSSSKMLSGAQLYLKRAGLHATLIHDDALAPRHDWGKQTVIVAPFFLNVFGRNIVPQLVARLTDHLEPKGALVVADFRAPSQHRLFSLIQKAYYFPPLLLFWACTKNAWHELYDYEAIFREAQLPLVRVKEQLIKGWGLPLFASSVWHRND